MTRFYDPEGVLIELGGAAGWTLTDALAGVLVTGSIGGGKSSGPGRLLRKTFLRSTPALPGGMGGIVFFAKNGEADEWEEACRRNGRAADVIRITPGGRYGFNFMDWIANWGEGAERGPIPTVALLEEIGSVVSPDVGSGGGDNAFFYTALRIKLTNLVLLAQLARLRVSLALLSALSGSAPLNRAQAGEPEWREKSALWLALREAEHWTQGDTAARKDFQVVERYFLEGYADLDDRPKSSIEIMFDQLVTPFLSRPLRPMLCEETNVWPEQCFDGKILLIDMPVQEYGLAGRLAALAFKRCFQLAVMRRSGAPGSLRPVMLFADEAQNFISPLDAEYQAVARSAGGVTCFLTQQISSIREAMHSKDKAENLTSNLQTKFFCQNTGETNEWASQLIGQRLVQETNLNVGRGASVQEGVMGDASSNTGLSRQWQQRRYLEASAFQKLRRGGPSNGLMVDAVLFCGGRLFPGDGGETVPYKILRFNQQT